MNIGRSSINVALVVLTLLVEICSAEELPVQPPPSQSVAHTTDPHDLEFIDALNIVIPHLMRAHNVPGLNIALARRGRIIWEGAYGYADAKLRRPMAVDTVFHSGSIAKAYVVTALMQLAEQGLLKVDDPINQYLAFEVRNPLGGPPITIRHLLTHTSGLASSNVDSINYLCDGATPVRPLAEVLQKAYGQHAWDPQGAFQIWSQPTGAKWQYSNLGIATGALIVERINLEHLSYSDYVQKRIMNPLGMQHAQIPVAQIRELTRPDIWDRASIGYQTMGGAWIPTAQVCVGTFPCGGSFATPADYLRLIIATMHGGLFNSIRILKEKSVSSMLTPASEGTGTDYTDLGTGKSQGLVWVLRDWTSPNSSFLHWGGHMWGWETTAMAFPHSDTGFVAAVNHWSSLEDYGGLQNRPELKRLAAFIEAWPNAEQTGTTKGLIKTWVKAEYPRELPKVPQIQDINWKASYLRGLLFAESYQFSLRTPQRLTEDEARAFAERTETSLSASQPALWNQEGFIAGVRAMSLLPPLAKGIRKFARSKRMQISLEEAKQLYPLLGADAGSYATLAGLLSIQPTQSH